MKNTHTLSRQEGEMLLEKVLDSIFILREEGTKEQDLEDLKRSTETLSEYYGVTQKELNYICLTASVVTIEVGKGVSFPLDVFWGTTSKLVTKAGGQI